MLLVGIPTHWLTGNAEADDERSEEDTGMTVVGTSHERQLTVVGARAAGRDDASLRIPSR